jgi:hypothetical protein
VVTLSSPVDDAKCYELVHLHWGISQEKLPAYLAILASFSSSTTPAGEAKRCLVPSSPPWSHDQTATTRKSGKAKVKSQAAEDARGPVFEYAVPNDSL